MQFTGVGPLDRLELFYTPDDSPNGFPNILESIRHALSW